MKKTVLGGIVVIVIIGLVLTFIPGLFGYLKNQFLLFTGSFTIEEELKPALFVAPYSYGIYTSRGENISRDYLPAGTFIVDAARVGNRVAVVTRSPQPDVQYAVWVDGVQQTSSTLKKESIDISPDGTRIAYVEYVGESPSVIITSGEEAKTLTGVSHPLFLSNTLLLLATASGTGFYTVDTPQNTIRSTGHAGVPEAVSPDRSLVTMVDAEKGQATVYWSVDQKDGLLMPRITVPYLSSSSLAVTSRALYVLNPADESHNRTLLKYPFGGEVTKLRTYDRDMYITSILP